MRGLDGWHKETRPCQRTSAIIDALMRTLAVVALLLSTLVTAQETRPARPRADLEATLAQVSHQVEAYYSRARAILCAERVVLQPLGADLTTDGFARRLEYELRVEWEPPSGADGAQVTRRLLSVNGRPPRPAAIRWP